MSKILNVFKDKMFLRTIFVLAIPMTLQSFITSSLNLIDNLMIGSLGETSIASVGLANQFVFIFNLCVIGINAGASIFMAQYYGRKDINSIKKVLGLDIVIGLFATIFFMFLALGLPSKVMGILSPDAAVIESGSSYLFVVGISFIFMNFTQAFASALRSTNQVKVPMYGSLIGVIVNAVLNWVLIFGNLGFPELGIVGAAIATTTARFVEMVFVVGYVYLSNNMIKANLKELMSFDFGFVKTYFKTSWSVIVNELVWSLGITAYSMAYALISTEAVAAMQIANTIQNLFIVLLFGIANAAAIIIGNKIGANEEEVAKDYAQKIGVLSVIFGLIIGVFVYVCSPFFVGFFKIAPSTLDDVITVLKIMAIFLAVRSFNLTVIVGIFRGSGDTNYSMLVQLGTVWLYSVPLAFIGATVLNFTVTQVFFFICTEEIIKIFFELSRLKSGKWIKNVIKEEDSNSELCFE